MSSKKVIFLNDVRLSFPDLWHPGRDQKDSRTGKVSPGKFGGQFIFDKLTELQPHPITGEATVVPPFMLMQRTMLELAQQEFGANWQNIMRVMDKKNKAMRNGDDNLDKGGTIRDGYAGKYFVKASAKSKPSIIGPRKNPNTGKFDELLEADGKPYGGCFVNAKIEVIAGKSFENVPNQIYARLLAVQFIRDGEAFSGAPGTSEGFDDVEGGEAAPEVSGGADDMDAMFS